MTDFWDEWDPSEREKAEKSGFDPNQPRDEHGQWTRVGITSQRPERTDKKLISQQMREFEKALRSIKTVSEVSVTMGTGGWEGGSEHTWVTVYKGNGEALKLLAETGKRYEQDAVLVARDSKEGEPRGHFHFDHRLRAREVKDAEKEVVKEGIGGWTWGRDKNGRTILMLQHVPDPAWSSMDAAGHEKALNNLSKTFSGARLERFKTQVTILNKENYDDYAGGRRSFS